VGSFCGFIIEIKGGTVAPTTTRWNESGLREQPASVTLSSPARNPGSSRSRASSSVESANVDERTTRPRYLSKVAQLARENENSPRAATPFSSQQSQLYRDGT